MIYRKGEMVLILSQSKIGRVYKVKDLEKDTHPFVVIFYGDLDNDGIKETYAHEELLLISNQIEYKDKIQNFKDKEKKCRKY